MVFFELQLAYNKFRFKETEVVLFKQRNYCVEPVSATLRGQYRKLYVAEIGLVIH